MERSFFKKIKNLITLFSEIYGKIFDKFCFRKKRRKGERNEHKKRTLVGGEASESASLTKKIRGFWVKTPLAKALFLAWQKDYFKMVNTKVYLWKAKVK